jgi:hypothetical protein
MRSDLKLQVSVRKLACVLDPALLLCHAQGPTLAMRLTQVMEPWVTRSFWQALDASELLAGDAASPLSGAALSEWLALREHTDAGSWLLRWIGDRLAESQLRDEADAHVIERWEALAEGLAARLAPHGQSSWCSGFDTNAVSLDALALSATLDGALVLCDAGSDQEPGPVQAARAAALRTQRLEPLPADSLFSAERALVRQSLAHAGLAALLEDELRLAAVHVLPRADDAANVDADAIDPWAGARVWWYAV